MSISIFGILDARSVDDRTLSCVKYDEELRMDSKGDLINADGPLLDDDRGPVPVRSWYPYKMTLRGVAAHFRGWEMVHDLPLIMKSWEEHEWERGGSGVYDPVVEASR